MKKVLLGIYNLVGSIIIILLSPILIVAFFINDHILKS